MKEAIETLFGMPVSEWTESEDGLLEEFLFALDAGQVRAAEPCPDSPGGWWVNGWVKQGILCGFRRGQVVSMGGQFFDKSTYPLKNLDIDSGVRVVPGGSSIRFGAYLAPGVVCMPPMYVNVGAYVGEGTMIDSHALVGSCAQIGARCHISAAAQIGGVLEPVGAMPVIIEDDVMIGGNCGVYEGVMVRAGAVLGSGVILNASTPIFDIVNDSVYHTVVPPGAVVVAGSRETKKPGISIYTPVIVKYRDDKTDSRVQLEDWLR